MSNIDLRDTRVSTATAGELDALYSNLLLGLHAASQPLTLLRAGLWDESVRTMTEAEMREFLEHSASAVERLCLFFNLTRELVNAECTPAQTSHFDLLSSLRELCDESAADFARDEKCLQFSIATAGCEAIGDRAGTVKALATVLDMVRSLSRPGDRICLQALPTDAHIEVVLSNAALRPAALDAEVSLTLAVTNSVLKKQRAMLSYELNPFCLRMRFKQAPQWIWSTPE